MTIPVHKNEADLRQQLLALHADALADAVRLVRCCADADMSAPTPCGHWDLSGLLCHMVGQNNGFADAVTTGDAPASAYEGVAITRDTAESLWRQSAERLAAAFRDAPAGRTVHLAEVGTTVSVETALRMQILDTAVHTWDLAASIGADYRPDPEVVGLVLDFARTIVRLPASTRTGFASPLATVGEPWTDALRLLGREAPAPRHRVITPRVFYFGTPVVLISTENSDGSANLAPMSSAWWIGNSCLLGLDADSATTLNLRRTGELVLNLPHTALAAAVDRLALTTGTPQVPAHKVVKGYEYVADKFARARLTPVESDCVRPPRVGECPIALEATVSDIRSFGGAESGVVAIEARIVRSHAFDAVMIPGSDRYIDAERWDPLIMKFTHLYGNAARVGPSRLAEGWQIPISGEEPAHA